MRKSLLPAVLSLVVVGFGQPGWVPLLAPFAASFGYALFWRAFLVFPSRKKRFWAAAVWFAAVQTIHLSWMTAYEYQGVYILFLYAFLAFGLGAQFGLISLFIPSKGPMPLKRLLALASSWTLFEWMRYFILCGFSFDPIGLSLTTSLYSLQFAALWGVLGLTFWVLLTNGLAFNLATKTSFATWLIVAAFPYLFGFVHLSFHQNRAAHSPTITAALVQPGLLPSQKVLLTGRARDFVPPLEQWRRIIHSLQESHRTSFDLIALPEAALPFLVDQPIYPLSAALDLFDEEFGPGVRDRLPPLAEKVSNAFFAQTIANFFHATFIAGFDGSDPVGFVNAAYQFRPNNDTVQRYDKRILMPLAEYLPFEWAKTLAAAYGITAFFHPGKEAKVFQGEVAISPSICYEETFPHIMREGRRAGATLFVNLTNDNWYPRSRLPKQHFDLGRIRTVENGAPLLRSCNSGVTAAVDSLGRIVSKTTSDEADVIVATITTYHYKTPFVFWGNAGIISLASFFTLFFLTYRTKKVERNRTCPK